MHTETQELLVVDFERGITRQRGRSGRAKKMPASAPGVVLGTLSEWDEAGEPLVDYPGNPSSRHLPSRSTVTLKQDDLGKEVALMFIDADPSRPLIVGVLEPPRRSDLKKPLTAEVDGERLVFTADHEIEFRCGKASITLTRAGKILIKGAYLLSRSSGVNRIKGGSVQIN
jgi:hypothetical protein